MCEHDEMPGIAENEDEFLINREKRELSKEREAAVETDPTESLVACADAETQKRRSALARSHCSRSSCTTSPPYAVSSTGITSQLQTNMTI